VVHRPYLIVLPVLLILAPVMSAGAGDIQTITHGREVEIEDHLVAGKYVLFDFYADWCGPCRGLEPQIRELAGQYDDQLAVRKIDIINWDSPVSRQFRMSSIPYMILYGPDGEPITAGDAGSVMHRLRVALGSPSGRSTPAASGFPPVPVLATAAIVAAAVALVVRRRRRKPVATQRSDSHSSLPPVDTAADPGDPAIWFAVLEGNLDGPFTRRQLGELVERRRLQASATVRRRGDASWTEVRDVLD
jgi:thiol-disulfide isomerase/thioredoxin